MPKTSKKTPAPPPQEKKEYIVMEKDYFLAMHNKMNYLLELHKTDILKRECDDRQHQNEILENIANSLTERNNIFTNEILSLREEIKLLKHKTIF